MTEHFEQAAATAPWATEQPCARLALPPTNILLPERGLDYKVYLQTLLHEALAKAAQQP